MKSYVQTKKSRLKVDDETLVKMLRLYYVDKLSVRKVADVMGISHMSVYRAVTDANIELLI